MRRSRALLVLLLAMAVSAAAADDYSVLKFNVVKATNGKPVRNAAVILHPVGEDGGQERGGLELKTNSEGYAEYRGIPYGKLRVQVIARGFQTFGQDYDVDQPTKEVTIKLKPPQRQYSTYEEPSKDSQNEKQKENSQTEKK